MTDLPDPLPYELTTPFTEAIENVVHEATTAAKDFGHDLQSVLSIGPRVGLPGEIGAAYPATTTSYVTAVAKLWISTLRGMASTWSAIGDSLATVAVDVTDGWWTPAVSVAWPAAVADGTLEARVTTVPGGAVPSDRVVVGWPLNDVFVAVASGGSVAAGTPTTVHVGVKQVGEFKPQAVRIDFVHRDTAGQETVAVPIDTYLSL